MARGPAARGAVDPARPAGPRWARALDVSAGVVGVLASALVALTCASLTALFDITWLTTVTIVAYVFVPALALGLFLARAVQRRRSWWWPWAAVLVVLVVFYASAAVAGAVLG